MGYRAARTSPKITITFTNKTDLKEILLKIILTKLIFVQLNKINN